MRTSSTSTATLLPTTSNEAEMTSKSCRSEVAAPAPALSHADNAIAIASGIPVADYAALASLFAEYPAPRPLPERLAVQFGRPIEDAERAIEEAAGGYPEQLKSYGVTSSRPWNEGGQVAGARLSWRDDLVAGDVHFARAPIEAFLERVLAAAEEA